jgi:hypothetical protein
MNANEALKLTQQNWGENENKYLTYVVGYQQKVEQAAKDGKVSCTVSILPAGNPSLVDFTAAFFEQQGYYVGFQGTLTGEISVYLNWKNEPMGSRPYLEAKELSNSLKQV